MDVTSAFRALVQAIAAEADKIASIGGEDYIGYGGLAETDARQEAEGKFEGALERFVERIIQEKIDAC